MTTLNLAPLADESANAPLKGTNAFARSNICTPPPTLKIVAPPLPTRAVDRFQHLMKSQQTDACNSGVELTSSGRVVGHGPLDSLALVLMDLGVHRPTLQCLHHRALMPVAAIRAADSGNYC